ncbi:glycosyltransferase family 2 protein [Bacteroides sp. GD17]|jgi:glycosyltransferase involved in cell wall biosynthesis|uniref:glycosyltransferase family 2 protein n=1 Tax=Bacteroides sp. GD17 TaxID=3139826 RepID=UPI00313BF3BF
MKFSVCIATFNGEKFIKEQLDSILCQLGVDDEIIISDDSSVDQTISIIESYKDKRIKIFVNQKFSSPIYNFENAIMKSTGDFIFLSDQDDIWQSDKVEKMLPLLERYDLVMSNARVVDASTEIIKEKLYMKYPIKSFLYNLIRNPYTGCLIAFNRKALDYILPFPQKLPMHDSWIGLCCQSFSRVYFLDENLILYRRHGMNASSTSERSSLSYLYRLQYRIYMLWQIAKRRMTYSYCSYFKR